MKTEAKLQFFSGFYESIWSPDSGLSNFEYEEGVDYEDYDFDNAAYEKDVAEHVVDCYQSWLNEALGNDVVKVTFVGITSPKYYNFATDSIDVELEFDYDSVMIMKEKFNEHKELLSRVIKENHTSYDGFMSFLSNDADDWMEKCFDDDEYRMPAYISCLLDYLIFADKKSRGMGTDLNYEAYEFCDVFPEAYCTIKEKEVDA